MQDSNWISKDYKTPNHPDFKSNRFLEKDTGSMLSDLATTDIAKSTGLCCADKAGRAEGLPFCQFNGH